MDHQTHSAKDVYADENVLHATKQVSHAHRLPLQSLHPNVVSQQDGLLHPESASQQVAANNELQTINSDVTIDDESSDGYQGAHVATSIDSTADRMELEPVEGQIFESTANSISQTTPTSMASTPSEVTSMHSARSMRISANNTEDYGMEQLGEVTQLRITLQSVPPHGCNPCALFPIDTQQNYLVREQCAEVVLATPGLLDEDDEDTWDPSMACEYSEEIFHHMHVIELKMLPSSGYMAHQEDLTWHFRGMLVDWLVSVHYKFSLLPETLFLCVNYIDRFLSVKTIKLGQVQLIGAVALLMATKFEEISYLSLQEVRQIVDDRYTVEEIKAAERNMFEKLEFNLGYPGPMSFLRRVSKADDYDIETRTLAKYLLEITIMDERFVGAPASWCAAIAHYMSRHMLRKGSWTARHIYFSNYTEDQLESGVKAVREALCNPSAHHRAIFDKYAERKFRKASLFVQNWLAMVQRSPSLDFNFEN